MKKSKKKKIKRTPEQMKKLREKQRKMMKVSMKKHKQNNNKHKENGEMNNKQRQSLKNGDVNSQFLLSKITKNFGGQYVNELPSDYKKPDGFCDDLGLLLGEQGLKDHRIYFQMNIEVMGMNVGRIIFPTIYNKNPYDFVNTSFCPIDSQIMGFEKGGMFFWSTDFQFCLGNQMMWLKTTHPNPDKLTESIMISMVFPKGQSQMRKFGQSIWDNNGGYGKFKVTPPIRKRNRLINKVEFYSVLIFDGYDTMKDTNGFNSSMFTDEFEKNFDFVGV